MRAAGRSVSTLSFGFTSYPARGRAERVANVASSPVSGSRTHHCPAVPARARSWFSYPRRRSSAVFSASRARRQPAASRAGSRTCASGSMSA